MYPFFKQQMLHMCMCLAIHRELFTTHQFSSHPTIYMNSMEVVQVPFKYSCLEIPNVVCKYYKLYCSFINYMIHIFIYFPFSHQVAPKISRYVLLYCNMSEKLTFDLCVCVVCVCVRHNFSYNYNTRVYQEFKPWYYAYTSCTTGDIHYQ